MAEVRQAASGQTVRTAWTVDQDGRHTFAGYYVPAGALVHLTDGTPYSRTGRNVLALCGKTVRPEPVVARGDVRVCPACQRKV